MKRVLLGIICFGALVVGCQEKPDPVEEPVAGPELVSSDPADGAKGVAYGDLTMKLTFDSSVMCPTAKRESITVDNGAEIVAIEPYAKVITVELTGLQPMTSYKVTFPEGTVIGYKENEADAFSISFTTMEQLAEPEPKPATVLDPVKSLVNPNASQQAKKVYEFLLQQSGSKILSGVQSNHSNRNDMVDLVYETTGKHPALAGYDFLFLHFSPTPASWSWVQDYNDISAQKEQWAANGLVNYMWHWNVPNSEADWKNGVDNYNFDGYNFYTSKTTFDINAALTEGTWQNEFIMKDIEEVAGYLQLLEDENIPVIWRPLHEAAGNYNLYSSNGAWFWWGKGGAEPCKKLWRLLYDQLVNVYGLDNLIWVWTVDVTQGVEDQYLDWYPGNDYVDVVGVDIYEDNTNAKERQYQALVDMTEGKKLVTVSECGNIPDPTASHDVGHKWSWFMVWASSDSAGNPSLYNDNWKLNTNAYWTQVMTNPYVLTREAMPSLK